MVRPVLLNNVDHAQLRVVKHRSAALGDDVMHAVALPDEFRELQAHYPIVFRQLDEQGLAGSFQPVALFGFEAGQNLFLGPDGWDAAYLPLSMERHPFLIGRDRSEMLVHVDLDSPRLSTDDGEALFLPHGGSAPLLERITSVLWTLHQGLERLPAFIGALLKHQLLESFVLDVELPEGGQGRLSGFHVVHEERLAALDATALDELHRAGHLLPIYMALASLGRLRDLVVRHRRTQHAA
jgi:hypothetical protein